jgi:hypothetical protein
MSIFEKLFGNAQPAPAPAPAPQAAPATPGNIPAVPPANNPVATNGTAPNGVVPNDPATNGTAAPSLDAFKDIWSVDPNAGAQGQPLFNVDQAKMLEAARKQNFTSGINPDLVNKVAAGGAEGVQAMMEIMNMVSQNVYAQSAFAGTKLIEGALDKSQFARSADLDTRFKSLSVSNNLAEQNPIFNNPAAKPMLDMVKNQILVKHPNASQQELTRMAQDYLTSFANEISAPQAQQQQQQQAKAAQGTDWSTFL